MAEFKNGDHVRISFDGVWENDRVMVKPFAFGGAFQNLDAATLEKIEPPVVTFKPGDRLRRKTDNKWGLAYDITLGSDGYLQHHGSGEVYYSEYGHKEQLTFNSDRYEKVDLG